MKQTQILSACLFFALSLVSLGLQAQPFTGEHGERVLSAEMMPFCFSPDGKYLIDYCYGAVEIRESETGKVLKRYPVKSPESPLAAMQITPDGKKIVFVKGNSVILDFETGQTLFSFKANLNYSNALSISPDSRYAAITVYDGYSVFMELLNLETGLIEVRFPNSDSSFASFSNDMKYIAGGAARVWDLKGNEIMHYPHSMNVECVYLSSDSTYLYTMTGDLTWHKWNTFTGENLGTLPFKGSGRLAEDGKTLVFLQQNQSSTDVNTFDFDTGTLAKKFEIPGKVYGTLIPAGLNYLITMQNSSTYEVYDFKTGTKMERVIGDSIGSINLSKFYDNGTMIAVAASNGVHLLDAKTGNIVQSMAQDQYALDLDVSQDGQLLAVLHPEGITFYNKQHGSKRNSLHASSLREGDFSMQFLADSKTLLQILGITPGKAVAQLADSRTGKILKTFSLPSALLPPKTMANAKPFCDVPLETQFTPLAPDGKSFVSHAGDMKRIAVWDIESGTVTFVLKGHTGDIHSACFTADGKKIITGSLDKSVRLWDAQTGDLLKTYLFEYPVQRAALSPDEHYLCMGGLDSHNRISIQIWDTSQDRAAVKWTVLDKYTFTGITGMTFSPDGKELMISSENNLVVWDMAILLKSPFAIESSAMQSFGSLK